MSLFSETPMYSFELQLVNHVGPSISLPGGSSSSLPRDLR